MKLVLNTSIILKILFYAIIIYFIYLLTLITIQYIPINYEVAFLNLKQKEIKYLHYKVAFFSHVYSSIFVISIALLQFSKTIRNQFKSIHKLSGKIYVLLILFIASPSGLIMSFHANGGLISKISFSILSVLWFYFTFKAYSSIREGNYQNHKYFMMRSYALTLSAISLRLFKYLLVLIFEMSPIDIYKIISVLSWTINLAIVEIIIKNSRIKNLKIQTYEVLKNR